MLFLREIQFHKYEDDGAVRSYWMFTKDKGWVHRDHIMSREVIALSREVEIAKLPDNYGMQPIPT
jgi:hypothetical protein